MDKKRKPRSRTGDGWHTLKLAIVHETLGSKVVAVLTGKTPSQLSNSSRSPYKAWLEETQEHDLHHPTVVFKATGRAPIDAPKHQVCPLEPPEDDDEHGQQPRSFSQICGDVIIDQTKVYALAPIAIYRACDFFQVCSPSFVQALVSSGGTTAWVGESLGSGSVIYEKGERDCSMYIIAKGSATVIKSRRREHQIGPGSYFGHYQLLGVLPQRHETVRAKTGLHLFRIHQDVFTQVLKRTKDEDDRLSGGLFQDSDPSATRSSLHAQAMAYPHERKHFENEAMKMYRTFNRGRIQRSNTGCSSPGATFNMTSVDETKESEGRPEFVRSDSSPKRRTQQGTFIKTSEEDSVFVPFASHNDNTKVAQIEARENLLTNLIESLRADLKCHFKMPAEAKHTSMKLRATSFAKSLSLHGSQDKAAESQTTTQVVQQVLRESFCEGEEDETLALDTLEVDALPPLDLLTSVQKHDLLRQLRAHMMQRRPKVSPRKSYVGKFKSLFSDSSSVGGEFSQLGSSPGGSDDHDGAASPASISSPSSPRHRMALGF